MRVGQKQPEKRKKSVKVAENPLKRMLYEDEDMPEYDRLRQKNIQQRLEMFNQVCRVTETTRAVLFMGYF